MTELSIKIKEITAKKIYKISKESNRDSSYHINIALENYIKDQEDLKSASKRLKDKNDKVISSKQLRTSLGI